MSEISKPHSEFPMSGFHSWAMADGNPQSEWLIERHEARSIFEQLGIQTDRAQDYWDCWKRAEAQYEDVMGNWHDCKEAHRSLEEQLQELHAAATPFGHMAQEMLTGHPTGHLPKGAPERLLAALKVVDGA